MKEQLHDREFKELVKCMVDIKTDATRRYGVGCWNSLGPKGLFADINRKYHRMKNFVWDESQKPSSENFEDTCLDMAVYSLLMIMSWRRTQKAKHV